METDKLQVVFNGTEKVAELIIREGEAPKQLDSKAPVQIGIVGTIGAPFEFLLRRKEVIESLDKCHVLVNRNDISIILVVNENDAYNKGTVKGILEVHPKFREFRINSKETWEPNELGQFFKMNRAFFPDKEENMTLVSVLKNFEATIDSKIEKQKEDKGSFKDNYSAVVNSNLPGTFKVSIPIFKGQAKVDLNVEFYASVSGRDIKLQLVSPDATVSTEDIRDVVIDDQISKIREIAPNIVIIEQ
jgi:hypothetical protein